MTKAFRYILCLIICFSLIVPCLPAQRVEAAYVYSDGYTTVGGVTMPFPEYMPGSYFTKNGSACTCHGVASINCVASGANCNCLRYVTVGGKEVDLLGVQCAGFARYCFYRLFGVVDNLESPINTNAYGYYNAGTIPYGNVNAGTVKALFDKLKPGAHVRYQRAYTQHSVVLLNKDANGFTVYHANSGGNGIEQGDCVVSTLSYTWEQFAATAVLGILYAHMPVNYPGEPVYSDTPTVPTLTVGTYITTSNLNLRKEPGTAYESLTVIPEGSSIFVSELKDGWGKTAYGQYEGWVSLAYCSLTSQLTLKADSGLTVKNGYLFGLTSNLNTTTVAEKFMDTGLTFSCKDGALVGTGTTIGALVAGEFVGQLTVVVIGDTDGDGLLSTSDFVKEKACLNGSTVLENAFLLAADTDGNGIVNTTDYKELRRIVNALD